jgi:hypothetical protein
LGVVWIGVFILSYFLGIRSALSCLGRATTQSQKALLA